jgi:hypothetical protein
MNTEHKQNYLNLSYGSLVGKTVSAVRALTDTEIDEMLWFRGEIGTVIEFTDGSYAIVSKDDEGNGAGTLILGEYATARRETARQILMGE